KDLKLSIKLHKQYPRHVIGFDTAYYEEDGYSTLYYLTQHLSQQENGYQTIPLYLHTGETSWPDDLMTSSFEDNPVPTLENTYESILLNSRRIGHGKGFIKKPYLLQKLKERRIAVEICLTSNQILGMEPDLRNHYGQIMYKMGIPIVLSPDDPGTFGYDSHTIDWYSAFMSWGLNLGDLKQLALNSLTYSGMTRDERETAINKKWLPSWDLYIKNTA
ncbi:hypothetical protein HELRODRAFT_134157, partial [Helobdella robusta]|uniref:Adenosine deaminase domain-containing protein n=1 Tax=Helobdella robusta TaxID=6412 RepID=T1EI34_HELRO